MKTLFTLDILFHLNSYISHKISKTSYTEKVAVMAKESVHTMPGPGGAGSDSEDEEGEGSKVLADSSVSVPDPAPSNTAIVSSQDDPTIDLSNQGEIVSSQTITSRSRTVETTTYSLQRDNGDAETHVEQKVTIQADGEAIDHEEALAQAIQEATAMNPDMTVEKIEIHRTSSAPHTDDDGEDDDEDGAV